jgi:hypothetical protein
LKGQHSENRIRLLHFDLIPSRISNSQAIQRKLDIDEAAINGQQKAFGIFSNGSSRRLSSCWMS